MSKLEIELLPKQAEFLQCEDFAAGMIGGLGSGKSFAAVCWFIDRVRTYPRGAHYICGRDLPQLKRGALVSLRGECERRGIRIKYNRSDGSILFQDTQTRVQCLSAENFLSFRGLEADSIWADEIADWGISGEEAFVKYMAPRVRNSPDGLIFYGNKLPPQLRFSTNPPTSMGHWLYDLLKVKLYCKYWQMSTRENYLMDRIGDYIENLQLSFAPDMWPILIDGEFGNVTTGQVYRGWDRAVHNGEPVFPLLPVQIDVTRPLCWALDFNVGLMCSVISQVHPQRILQEQSWSKWDNPFAGLKPKKRWLEVPNHQEKIWYVIGELRMPDCGTPDVVDEFIRQYGDIARRVGVRIYGDAAGGARAQTMSAQAAARSNWGIIIEGLKNAKIRYDFRVPTTNPSVMDRVNMVKAQMSNKDGNGLFVNREKALWLCKDFENVQWRPFKKEKDGRTVGSLNEINKDNPELTHLSDAIGYQIWLERALMMGRSIDLQKITTHR